MGKDRRKKDVGKKQPVTSTSEETDSGPKGQRERRARPQREIPKNTDLTVKSETQSITPDKEEEPKKTEPINTEELFANLKRETDDIKALTTKKFVRRQVVSNWAKYEEPPPDPDYENDIKGADFESLIQDPISEASHFQFKSERSWDTDVRGLSGELFSLDVDLLAAGLETIPFYKKLDIPITLFSESEVENMDFLAKQAMKQYDTTRKIVKKSRNNVKDSKDVTNRLLDLLKESSPVPVDTIQNEEKTTLNFDISEADNQNAVDEMEPYNNSYANDILKTSTKPDLKQTPSQSSKVPEILSENQNNSVIKSSNKVTADVFQFSDLETQKYSAELLSNKEVESRKENTLRTETMPMTDVKKENQNKKLKSDIPEQVQEARNGSTSFKHKKTEQFPLENDIQKENAEPKEVKSDTQPSELESSENWDQEPATPLGQRISRRKAKGQPKQSWNHSKSEISVSQSETVVSETESKTEISETKKNSNVPKQKTSQFVESQNELTVVSEAESKTKISEAEKNINVPKQRKSQFVESQNKSTVTSKTENKTQISETEKNANVPKQKRSQLVESQNKSRSSDNQARNQVRENMSKIASSEKQKNIQISEKQDRAQQSKPQLQSQEHEQADDLDFLLQLKKPVRDSQLSGIQPSQAAKPSIEEDDTPDTNLPLVSPQNQSQDLEDWLDSMLDD